MQHTKEVLISTDYNFEEALISTNQCLIRLIVTFLVEPSLTLTGKQIPSSICLRTLQLNLEKIGACILENFLKIKHSLVYQNPCCMKRVINY